MTGTGAAAIGQYTENITYDGPRGNISTLSRYGILANQNSGTYSSVQSGLIDNLSMTYVPGTNRLQTVTDAGQTGFVQQGFNQLPGTGNLLHQYDPSGNMTYDHSKRATIVYNHLNLPGSVTFQNGNKIDYTYDASGKKLTSTRSTNGTTVEIQQYLGGIEYKQVGSAYRLEAIYHPEGRLYNTNITNTSLSTISLRNEFCIKDHLGNTRLTFADKNNNGQIDVTTNGSTNEILQENHYYPFGMNMGGPWMNDLSGNDNPYQYNGKELESFGTLGWYDYGARFYDPSVGRWTSVDPLADAMPSHSPYSYGFNNPIIFIDPTGMYPIYGANGEYLGDDGRSGDGDLAFTGTVTKRDKDGKATEFGSLSQFTTDHKGFLNAAGKIKSESSGDKTESLWIAHTANNASKNKDTKAGDGVLGQLNASGYSTTSGSTSIEDNSSKGKNARAGLIDVLSGGADPTGGATHWDGIDFLQKGIDHNKFKEFSPINLNEGDFDAFQSAQSATYKTRTNSNFDKTCTPSCTNGNWGWSNGVFNYVGSRSRYYQLQSVGVKGATLFWKAKKN